MLFVVQRRDLLCNHGSGGIFSCEDNMLFLSVKISCFHAKARLVFHFVSVYIIKIIHIEVFLTNFEVLEIVMNHRI